MKSDKNIILLSFLLLFTFSNVNGQSIMEKLKANSETTQFAQALEDAGINDRLDQEGPFTVLVPTNSAFSDISRGQQSETSLLLNHIFTGMATERSLRAMSDITCLSGKMVSIQNKSGGNLSVDNNRIISSNIRARNGVIHVIDGVIN